MTQNICDGILKQPSKTVDGIEFEYTAQLINDIQVIVNESITL